MSISGRPLVVVALALSVLANIFLVGVVSGRLVFATSPRPAGHGRPIVPGVLVRTLPAEDRKRFTSVMRLHREAIARAHAAVAAAKSAAESDIAAPTYDRAKVEADFAAVRLANAADQEAVHAAYAEALATLGPASRATLVPRQVAPATP